jgi:hypothetical protein
VTIDGFCRELALDQPLIGSAPTASRWVLVEDNGRWGAKTPRDSDLPEPVKGWLRSHDQPGTRVHLIRRPAAVRLDGVRRVILASTPEQPELRRVVELDVELDRIPELDVDALLANADVAAGEPLWLVCTHGARDRCCAKWGMPMFEALRARAPHRVWQSSHLGGHRFAPTIVTLPFGLMWGRLSVEQLEALDDVLRRGELDFFECLRGRMCWPPQAQAAESVLRERERSMRATDALELDEIVELEPGRHRVTFRLRDRAAELRSVEIESIDLPEAPSSCGDPPGRQRALVALSSR